MPRRAHLLVLLLLFASGALALWWLLPQSTNHTDWILDEPGNQLLRARQLSQGKSLYRDIDFQYGPLPVLMWFGFACVAGNTIGANLLFHALITGALLAALYWWATQGVVPRAVCPYIVIALAVLTFARTPFRYLIFISRANFEYFSLERLYLLAYIVLWQPPLRRTWRHGAALVVVFLVWQCSKAGGAFFALAAFGAMDVVWFVSRVAPPQRQWFRWWLWTIAGVATMEGLRSAVYVLVLGGDQGWRSAWPTYVVREYTRTWLSPWASAPHFITVVLPIAALVVLFIISLTKLIVRQSTSDGIDVRLMFQAGVGGAFYLLASVPFVGYFGHEYHFFQYQWALLPVALVYLRRNRVAALAFLLLVHAGPLYLTVTEIRQGTTRELDRVQTAIGPIVAPRGDDALAFVRAALAAVQAEPPVHSLILGGWGGGGWYVVSREVNVPVNIFFSSAGIRRRADNVEVASLIGTAGVVLARTRLSDNGTYDLLWVETVAGRAAAIQLESYVPRRPLDPTRDGWVLLRRQ